MPTSLIYSREAWEARSKESRSSGNVEPPTQGIAGALLNLSGNTSLLNRDQGLKKSDVVAGRDSQKNPGLVMLSTVSTQITCSQQHESDPHHKGPEEGSKKFIGLKMKANQRVGSSIANANALFDSNSRSNSSWHDYALHYSQRSKMMERIFVYFRGKEPSSPEYQEQLLSHTKQLELKLYQSAPSFEAYLDKLTKSGLQHLAVRVAMERWPSGPQLVRAALQSTEHNQLQCKFEHKVAALQKEVDRVTNEKSHVDAQLKEAVDQLKAKESLLGDKEEALEQLQLLQQQRDAEIEYLKLQVLTMRAEITTLASEKAKAVEEATRAALESKSLLEDVQAYKSKYDKLKVETQSMSVRIMAMEKDVVDSVIKDEKIKALAEKVEVLTNTVNEAVTAKADVIIQSEEATRALLAKDREIAAREYQKNELSKRLVLLQQTKNDEMARAESALEKTALELKTLIEEVQVVKSEKMLLIEQMNTISTSNESLETQRIYLQHQLDSLVRIDRIEDMEQQCNVIKLNERIISLQQAHDDALSSLKHKHEVVLSEKRSLEQTILNMRSMSNEGRGSSRSSITQKALLLFQAGVSILTNKTTASGFDLDTSETETTISSRIDGTRSEQLPIAALSPFQGSMVNEVEYSAGAVMKGGRKRTHMNSVSDGSNKSNKSPRL